MVGVGDARFRDKAARLMDELMGRVRAISIVTYIVDFLPQAPHPHVAVSRCMNDLHLGKAGVDA